MAKPALDQNKDNHRKSERSELSKIPACFVSANNEDSLLCRIADISERGVGIESKHILEVGTIISLVTIKHKIEFKVLWIQASNDAEPAFPFRYGLTPTDKNINLKKIFQI